MYTPEIIEVKNHLEQLKSNGLIDKWELPYEQVLTRLSAAIFFITPVDESKITSIDIELQKYENFSKRVNLEKTLSQLQYRVTFNKDEKKKNSQLTEA